MAQQSTTTRTSDDRTSERWYLRIDGQRYGPVGRAELEKFLAPPRLCSVLEVKCGDDGDWVYITREETIDKVLVRFGVDPDPVVGAPEYVRSARTPKRLEGVRDFIEGLSAWLIHHWVAAASVVAIVAINAAVLFLLNDPHGREREILARYEALWQEVRRFSSDSPKEDWRKFAEPALIELEPMIRELEKSASVHHPSRQNLLFAGRDHLRTLLKAEVPPTPQTPQAILFERRMQGARAQFLPTSADPGNPLSKGKR